jgi:hypothetical protein
MAILIREEVMKTKNEQELTEAQRNQQSLFISVKIRVTRKPELENDFEMLKLYWSREIKKALNEIGDVKAISVMT